MDTFNRSNNELYSIASYRETQQKEYVDGLSYNDIKNMKITKEHIYTQFRLFDTYDIRETRIPHISIEWCIFHPIRDHYMDIWYMVFYIPPHNKRELLLYFLQKIYAELVMGKHVNYFHMWGSS